MVGVEEGLGISVCCQRGWQSRVTAKRQARAHRCGGRFRCGRRLCRVKLGGAAEVCPRACMLLRAARQSAFHKRYAEFRRRLDVTAV